MSFNFKESLSKGQNSASLVIKNQNELKTIYTELASVFSENFGFKVNLYDLVDYKGADSTNSLAQLAVSISIWNNPEKIATGYTKLVLGIEDTKVNRVTLFKYKEADDVYPITVLFNKNKTLCYSQNEFADVIKTIIENPRLNLDLIEFKNRVENLNILDEA